MPNIYAAPAAKLDGVTPLHAPPVKKPKAVLLLQVCVIAIMALMAVGFMKNLHNVDGSSSYAIFGIDGATRRYIMVGMIVFVLITLFALDQRTMLGRGMGLIIIFVCAAPAYVQLFMPSLRAPSMSVEVFRCLVILGFCAPFAYWAYAFSFSPRARRYFAEDVD